MSKRIATTLATVAASIVAMLSLAGPASAASFEANPPSLGAIPDGPASCAAYGANRDVTFAVSGVELPITNVAVTITLSPAHPFVGDLSVELLDPAGGGRTTIFERTGATTSSPTDFGHPASVAGPYTFSDEAPASPTWWQAAFDAGLGTIPSGSYRASFPGGQAAPPPGENYLLTPAWEYYFRLADPPAPNGTWILRFGDHCGPGFTGSVAAATLALNEPITPPGPGTTTPPPVVSPPQPTGQRAAALKKCKKKKSKKARKKCKKKARSLPI